MDGSSTNASGLRSTQARLVSEWKGPIVVMRQPSMKIDPLVYEDMTLADLRIVIDSFISYGDESVQDLKIRGMNLSSNATGVRINCEGDQKFRAGKFASGRPKRSHGIPGYQGTSRGQWLSASGAEITC